jgi:hypothetical protein
VVITAIIDTDHPPSFTAGYEEPSAESASGGKAFKTELPSCYRTDLDFAVGFIETP